MRKNHSNSSEVSNKQIAEQFGASQLFQSTCISYTLLELPLEYLSEIFSYPKQSETSRFVLLDRSVLEGGNLS